MDTINLVNSLNQKVTAFQDDWITEAIIKDGLYEKQNIKLILAIIQQIKSAVVFDIGANIGNHTLAFSTKASHVYSFEPVEQTFKILSKNVQQNNLKNVTVINAGLSNAICKMEINVNCFHNMGASSIHNSINSDKKENIKLITGDNFVKDNNIKRIDFLKIDVEGHELFAIKGIIQSINEFRPIVMMEWWKDQETIFVNENSLVNLFKNYHIFALGNNFAKAKWKNKIFGKWRRKLYKKRNEPFVELFSLTNNITFDEILLVPKEQIDLVINYVNKDYLI